MIRDELDLIALGGRNDLDVVLLRGGASPRAGELAANPGVAVRGVVMEEDEPLHTRAHGEVDRVFHRAVAPAALGGILAVGVLRIVDQHVDA